MIVDSDKFCERRSEARERSTSACSRSLVLRRAFNGEESEE